jgi:poly(A) polymerase
MASEERPLAGAAWLRAAESRRLIETLGRDGKLSRFVGGCVRDTLLDPGLDEVDLDVATQATPDEATALLEAAGIKVVPTGIEHGTVTAILDGRRFEVTTLRRDVETFGRHARVAFTDDFEADARRRDFTINALSCDLRGRLYDYVGGRPDLAAGRIRFVGDPAQRIREDYLRILRFFRFFARFGRPPADPPALAACRAERAGLRRLAPERIWSELKRLLVAPLAAQSLALMAGAGIWQELFGASPDLPLFGRLVLLEPAAPPVLRLASLLRHAGGGIDETAVRRLAEDGLRLSASERDDLLAFALADAPYAAVTDPAALRRLIHAKGAARARGLAALAWAEARAEPADFRRLVEACGDWQPPPLPISGRDVLARGVPPGPEVGRLLDHVERAWVASDFSLDREACLGRLEALLRRPLP